MSKNLTVGYVWEKRFKDLTGMFYKIEHIKRAYLETRKGKRLYPVEMVFKGKSVEEALTATYLAIWSQILVSLDEYSSWKPTPFNAKEGLNQHAVSLEDYVFVWRIEPDLEYSDSDGGYFSSYCRFLIYKRGEHEEC